MTSIMPSMKTRDDVLKPAPVWANVAATLTRRLPRGRTRVIAWLCRGSSRRFAGRMAPQLGSCTFDCSLRDMVARDVFFAGCFAAQELAFVRAALKPGMTFVDVGANWGLFTMVASTLVGSSGRVLALEPDPRILDKLKSNVDLNRLSQVQIAAVAAADCDSELLLAAHDHASDNWGISRLVENVPDGQPSFTVASRRLDSLLDESGVDAADLVKIDVEGAEDRVMQGMEAGLTRHRYRRILLEMHPLQLAERGRQPGELAAALQAKGYAGFSLDYSHAGIRRAYYHPWLPVSHFVRPLSEGMADPLPHTIWLAPGDTRRDLVIE